MTDIRTEAELRHPVPRVWRALTDAQLIGQWLGATDLQPEAGAPFELTPIDLPGVEGEVNGAVVEIAEPHLLVLRWREDGVRMLVRFELVDTEEGSRLTVRQSGTDGLWTAEQEQQRQQAYEQLLSGPLPAVLDWLAFREVDFTSEGAAAAGALGTGAESDMTEQGQPDRRRRRLVGGLIAAAIVAGAAMVVAALARPGPDATTAASQAPGVATSGSADADPSATPTASGAAAPPSRTGTPPASVSATASANPSATASPGTPPPPQAPAGGAAGPPAQPNLDARYTRASSELLGYTGEIVVTNSGTAPAGQWVVTVVLHGGATVADVSGADYQQKGRTVTFTGGSVAAGAAARFTFQVSAALSERQPESCRVGDRACSGL